MNKVEEIPILKPIVPFIQRSNELNGKAPIVSFYCKTYACQLGIELIQNQKDEKAQKYLINLMDSLEKEKQTINPNQKEAKAIVEIFGLKIFKKADDSDRENKQNSSVAKLFYVSSVILETTKLFGDISEDILEKIKVKALV
jgi:vacuolar protein sorting-associated protein VTA1